MTARHPTRRSTEPARKAEQTGYLARFDGTINQYAMGHGL